VEILDGGGSTRVPGQTPGSRADAAPAPDAVLDIGLTSAPPPALGAGQLGAGQLGAGQLGAGQPGAGQLGAGSSTDALGLPPDGGTARPRPAAAFAAIVSPEALGVTALMVAAGELTGGLGAQLMSFALYLGSTAGSPHSQAVLYGKTTIIGGAVAVLVAVAGLLRLHRARTAWAAGILGAALLLGLIVAALGGYMIWHAPGISESFSAGS